MRILHVNNVLPVDPMDGGRLRKRQHIEALAAAHDVWVLGRAPDAAARDALVAAHRDWTVVAVPEPADSSRNPVPAAVRDLTARVGFDVILVSGFAQWPGERAFGRSRVVLDIDSLDSTVFQRMRDTDGSLMSPFDIAATEALTRRVCTRADLVLACSDVDAARIAGLAPGTHVAVIPNAVDTSVFEPVAAVPLPEDPVVTFTGFLAYWPNADACLFLIRDVLPLLRPVVPAVRVRIVGRVPPEPLVALALEHDVELHADVPDIRPWFETSRVMVAPLRAGSGTRLKILEAFAAGRPMVSTTIGCEGLNVTDGEHLLVADDAAAFAAAIARVLLEPDLGRHLVTHARDRLRSHYDRATLGGRLLELIADLSAQPRRGVRPDACRE